MNGRRAHLLAFALLAGLSACRLSESERQAIKIWLLCDDCAAGERQRVAGLGRKAVPLLWGALRDGPPIEGRRNTEAQIRDLYRRLGLVAVTEAAFVSDYLSNYINNYRARAALSLGDIPAGAPALQEAIDKDVAGTEPLTGTLRLAVYAGAAAGYPAFSGALSDSSVPAFDTVVVRRGTAAWDGDESVSIRGGPFPNEVLVARAPDSLRFLAIGALGGHSITIENEGPSPTRAPLSITTLRYATHPPGLAPELGSRPFPQRHFLALGNPPASDTIEYFRFPAVGTNGLAVTATASWRSGANVDLAWQRCVGGTPVGNLDGSTGSQPERTTVVVPPGDCWNLVMVIRSHKATELIKLDLTSP